MTHSSDRPLIPGVDPVPGSYPPGPPASGGAQGTDPSITEVTKDQGGKVAETATAAGQHVAGVAGEQAGQVASEATEQVKELMRQSRSELTEQAATQQKRVAAGLRSIGDELQSMAHHSDQPGVATDLAKQAAERSRAVAGWLENREPGHVVDEVTRFARQRPGTFLALAAGAGFLVGRLGRGLKAATDDHGVDSADQVAASRTSPAVGERGMGIETESLTPPVASPAPDYGHGAPGYPPVPPTPPGSGYPPPSGPPPGSGYGPPPSGPSTSGYPPSGRGEQTP